MKDIHLIGRYIIESPSEDDGLEEWEDYLKGFLDLYKELDNIFYRLKE